MSCWCGHGPWHHYMHPYPPGYYLPPEHYGPPPEQPRRTAETEELTGFLRRLEEEIAALRRDLDELRRSGDKR
ncbi:MULTISPECIES: restriction endonuclease subunit S domain-containing protein [Streptomyces]|nr:MULTISPECIES: hypothetical protein [Streptomyces]MCH0561107.1 hypothetical protein [Streptomyces sp. MUM 16J]